MPTTFANLVPIRRVAVGDCSGPMGSGFDALARSAYAALLRADWTQSAEPPFLPVHDNGQTANKTIPHGDAWKCSYGYDAAARTERSACGAVCYTFALPSDATAGTPANISTVSLSLTGDRYLDAGVDLYLVPSESPTPPAIPDLLALTPVGTYCATSDQSPTPPNERHGVTEAVAATPGVAAQPYLHVALLLHDYTTNRGAWIEGGAMLEGAAATIGFSREVATPSGSERILRETAYFGEGSDRKVVTSMAAWFINYPYDTIASAPSSSDGVSDILSLIRTAYSGGVSPITAEWGFINGADWISSYGWNASECWGTISATFYMAPRNLQVGYNISAEYRVPPGMNIEAGGNAIAAMVQTENLPPIQGVMEPASLSVLPPIDEALFGDRGSIVSVGSVAVPAGDQHVFTYFNASMTVVRQPSKRYLALVLIPLSHIYAGIRPDKNGVLIAESPNTP